MTAWAALTAYVIGALRRQLAAPTVGQERVWRCTTAGTSGGSEPSWTLTKGSTTSDGSAVWTEVTGNSTYGWTAAHARLSTAAAWMAAGDDVYVSNNHAATQAATLTITMPGTATSPNRIICVSDAGSVPPVSADLAATAKESTTAAFGVNLDGHFYRYGLSLTRESSSASQIIALGTSGSASQVSINCADTLNATGSTARIQFGTSGNDCYFEFINCTFGFAAAGQGINNQARTKWRNATSAITGTVPTSLFIPGAGSGTMECRGVDLSALASGKNLVNVSALSRQSFVFIDCKLGSSVSPTTGSITGPGGIEVILINCDSGNTNYKYSGRCYQGTVDHELTIVRTSGASDGTNPISRKMVSSANSKFHVPLMSDWVSFWNNTTSSTTVTIPVVTDNVTLKDNDCWIEVEELGTSGFPLSVLQSDAAADVLNAGTNQTTDTSAWTTTGLTTPIKQQLSVTFTPSVKGPIRARVCLAKASTTVYFDPKILSNSGRQFQSGLMYQDEGPSGGGGATILHSSIIGAI